MKKLLILFLLISSFGFAQKVTITLQKTDIVDINRAIKQDMVQDSVINTEKTAAAKSCEDAFKKAATRQSVTVPLKYVQSSLQNLAWSYAEVERQMKSYRKFLRIVKQLAVNDPNLTFLTSGNSMPWISPSSVNEIKERIKTVVE